MSKKTKKTEWNKNCSECGNIQYYKSEIYLKRAIRDNLVCLSCSNSKKAKGENNSMWGKTHKSETIEKIRQSQIGKVIPEETKKLMSKSAKDRLSKHNHWVGRNHTDGAKRKMRIIASKRMVDNKWTPAHNPSSIPIIEAKARELGITDLQHAENGGEFYIEELGYWVDGYSKEKNIVIEYDEPYHQYHVERDIVREQKITEYLNCEFIRIVEK